MSKSKDLRKRMKDFVSRFPVDLCDVEPTIKFPQSEVLMIDAAIAEQDRRYRDISVRLEDSQRANKWLRADNEKKTAEIERLREALQKSQT